MNAEYTPEFRVTDEVVDWKDFTYFVYLVNGTCKELTPATGLRLTNDEVTFVLGELIVARLPRQEVYFAAREPIPPPALF